jgi:Ribonuclease G/E
VTLRGVIKEGTGPAGARLVEDITLEEAYLAFMAGRGRHVEELAMADN